MNMSIQHNLQAMNGGRMLNITTGEKAKKTEKLSSGYRINRAADDAAGLAISEKMRRQIRGLDQASRNIQDGISFAQTADGYLNEVHDILQRINQLAIQGANDTYSDQDRSYLDQEVQQLKEETKRIFNDAEFNEIKIWQVPYQPSPELDLSKEADIQVFNRQASGSAVFGGVEINDVRHTWQELGVPVSSDGSVFTKDWELEFKDYTGERVMLKGKEGDPSYKVTRNYEWVAQADGIYVNNVKATDWESIGISQTGNEGEHHFSFRNQEIYFTVNDGDSLEDVIDGINGGQLRTSFTWDMSAPYTDTSRAVNIVKGSTVEVTEANKNQIDREYHIYADESGVWVKDHMNRSGRKMSWEEFTGTPGGYPISDWGLTNKDGQGKNSGLVTFDDDVTYTYTDTSLLGQELSFGFTLADEASREAVIKGLNVAYFSNIINSPGRIEVSGGVSASGPITSSFEMQRAFGRNFDQVDAVLNGSFTRTLVNDDDTYAHYEYSGTFAGYAMDNVSGAQFEKAKMADGTYTGVDTVAVKTEKGTPMTLRFTNTASGWNETKNYTADFRATGKAGRSFVAGVQSDGNRNVAAQYRDIELQAPKRKLYIQSAVEAGQGITMEWDPLNNAILGIAGTNLSTQAACGAAIDQVKGALEKISSQRADFGAYQNRFEHSIKINKNSSENTSHAESQIRDADMASEMVDYSKHGILEQAGSSVLAQANRDRQGMLSLLQ